MQSRKDQLNPRLRDFSCLRCGCSLDIGDYYTGCPACLEEGYPSSVRHNYATDAPPQFKTGARGMHRFTDWLPYTAFATLGEGDTPLLSLGVLADEFELGELLLKSEGQNPTGSHKDRMSALAVTRAVDIGATTVVAASSGNAGASVAAYAAAAGLQCVIVTTPQMSPVWQRAITMTGARLVATAEAMARWQFVAEHVAAEHWFPVTNFLSPPVSSNHYGVEGLKTIAFELFRERGADSIDAILVPTSRADLLWGIYEGFRQLKAAGLQQSIPRMYAIEPFPRIAAVLDNADYRSSFPGDSKMVSVGGSTVSYQALDAVANSGGGAIAVDEASVVGDQGAFARQGIYLELSSAMTLTGLRRLRAAETIRAAERVVLIGSSNGYKELELPETPIPLVS